MLSSAETRPIRQIEISTPLHTNLVLVFRISLTHILDGFCIGLHVFDLSVKYSCCETWVNPCNTECNWVNFLVLATILTSDEECMSTKPGEVWRLRRNVVLTSWLVYWICNREDGLERWSFQSNVTRWMRIIFEVARNIDNLILGFTTIFTPLGVHRIEHECSWFPNIMCLRTWCDTSCSQRQIPTNITQREFKINTCFPICMGWIFTLSDNV